MADGIFIGLIISPIPKADAVFPIRQNGISAPTFLPILHNSVGEALVLVIVFKSSITAAPSVEPPASPAAIGIFLSIYIFILYSILSLTSYYFIRNKKYIFFILYKLFYFYMICSISRT